MTIFSSIARAMILLISSALMISCVGDNSPKEHLLQGLWLSVPDQEDPGQYDVVIEIDDAGMVFYYECYFLSFESQHFLGELDDNNLIERTSSYGEKIENSFSLLDGQLHLDSLVTSNEGQEDVTTSTYNKILSMPSACISGNYEMEITDVTPLVLSAGDDANIEINYRYRSLDLFESHSLALKVEHKLPLGDFVGFTDRLEIIEPEIITAGEVVEGRFNLAIEGDLIPEGGTHIFLKLGFFEDHENGGGFSSTGDHERTILIEPSLAPQPNDFTLMLDSIKARSANVSWSSFSIPGEEGAILADIYLDDQEVATGVTSIGWIFDFLSPDTDYVVKVVARSSAYGTTLEKTIEFKTEPLPSDFAVLSAELRPRTTGTFGAAPTILIALSNRDLLEDIIFEGVNFLGYSFAGDNSILITISDDEYETLSNAQNMQGIAEYIQDGVLNSISFDYTVQ